VTESEWLAERFEAHRAHLRGVAYRMLGSLSDADDAVQEAWLRLSRSDVSGVGNLAGWLTTVVARVCLDQLRTRKARPEESWGAGPPDSAAARAAGSDPEQETLMADSVGLALLVVLEMLTPAERLAFVLHDLFAVPFEEIAPIVGRSPTAARQLASRARRRVQGAPPVADRDVTRQREVVDAFLAASRQGDFEALLALLDPDVVLRADAAAMRTAGAAEIRGATALATRAVKGGARAAQPALVNGAVGVVVAPRGRLAMVLTFTIRNGRIVEMEAIGDTERVSLLDLRVLRV
jgi:RNA polymerase sigma factor (sigma-70 family)